MLGDTIGKINEDRIETVIRAVINRGIGLAIIAVLGWASAFAELAVTQVSSSRKSPVEEQFIYLSDQRVVTVELVDSASVIMNYINLGDTFDLFDPKNLVILDRMENAYRGHLIRLENPESADVPYQISELLKPDSIVGYEIVGAFDFKSQVSTVLFRIGGRILELEPINKRNFEIIAARISELDIQSEESKLSLQRAGFRRGFGKLIFAGTVDSAAYEAYFKDSDIVAPVAVAAPQPRLPSSESRLPDPVMVRLRAIVSRAGGLRDIQVLDSLNEKLDRIAVETVRNSWVFLPAIADGKIAESELVLRVIFQRQNEPQ